MNFIKKTKSYIEIIIFIFLIAFLPVATFLNQNFLTSKNSHYFDNRPLYPKTNEAPLYQVEWAHVDSLKGNAFDLVISPSEDIYMVYDGPSSGESTVIKYDKNGNFIWESSQDGGLNCIALDSSNNVYAAGYTADYDMILMKFSSSGVFQWSRVLDKRDYDFISSIAVDSLSNIYMAGMSYNSGTWVNRDIILVKYSSSGNYLWDRTLDIREEDMCKGLVTDSSNNVYLSGHHRDFSTTDDIFIAKYSSSGTLQWSQNWGTWYQDDEAQDIVLDSSNNIYVTGGTYESATNDDVILLKFNNAGNLQWSRRWGGDGIDIGFSIDLASDGDIFIGGGTYEGSGALYDILLAVYNSAGTMKWWGGWGGGQHDVGRGIAVTSSKNVYIGGESDNDLALLKFNPAPSITIISPIPNSLYTYTAPTYNVEIVDTDLIEKYYTVDDGPSRSFSGSVGTINQDDWDACASGLISLKFYGRDVAGSVYEEVIVRKDISAPDFEILAPTLYQLFTDIAPNYELTTSETEIDSMWYTLNGEGNFTITSLTGTIDQDAWNNLDNGSVLIEFFMKDIAGNIGSKTIEVYKYYEFPLIYINKPLQNQVYGLKAPKYNISITSYWSVNEMWYSLNGGSNITILKTEGSILQSEWDLIGNETVNITFYAKNNLENIGYSKVTIYKDIYFPFIEIYEPYPYQLCGISAPQYNVSISSVTLESKWYSLNHGQEIQFYDDTGTIDQLAWNVWGNGTVIITFYANNSAGVTNSREFLVYKDIRCPNITILAPNAYMIYGIEPIAYEISIDEPNLEKVWYSLNNGMNYSSSELNGFFDEDAWNACGNGTVTIRFYANNTLGNIGSTKVIIHKDIYFPFITIISPESGHLCGINAPNYNISVSTLDVDSMWYTLNAGINYPIMTTFGTINQDYWDIFSNGNITITFYVNNSYSQLNFKSVTVKKDISIPNITIISPQYYEVFGIGTIFFEVSIIDPNLNTTWYTLNGGMINFFTGNTGLINQTAWDLCGNGTVTIGFYASNIMGNIGYAEVVVHRDIYFPFMEIYSPSQDQITGLIPPKYNISVSSLAIDFMWYTLNHGEKVFFTNTEGEIDQSKWELFGEDTVTISFYANNSFGQMNSKEITIEKITYLRERNAYAIIIGISDYPGTDYDLSYCDDDAIAVYNMLINDYNFKPENIIYLQDSSATKNDIDDAFNTISSVINPNDIFYFYYSGHGGADIYSSGPTSFILNSPHPYPNSYDRTWLISATNAAYIRVHFSDFQLESGYDYLFIGDTFITIDYYYQYLTGYGTNFWSDWIPVLNDNSLYLRMITDSSITDWGFRIDQVEVMRYSDPHYLCSYDSIPSSPANYYIDTHLDSKLDSLNCDNKYVILDSCNSGGMIPESQEDNRFIMTACKAGQFSMEEPALDHGIFTYYLLNSLDNANDQNGDGVTSMEECFSYIYSATRSYSSSYGPGVQYHPQLYDGIEGQSVLYTSIGSLSYKFAENRLYYSFYLHGTGNLNMLNITLCSVLPEIQLKTVEIKNLMISYTGFGFYSDYIDLNPGNNVSSFEILCEVQGHDLITLKLSFGDTDGDGLTDVFEVSNGLNPLTNDTDSDGLTDGDELNIYGTNPLEPDTDFDGLLDYDEIFIYNTDPLNFDTDSDNLSDGAEINIHFTDPLNNDTDSDNLSDGDEVNLYTTNPLSNDTDSDELTDYEEVIIYNTNPLQGDTDSDGLLDGEEVHIYGTDPLLSDSDSDGLTDGEEVNIYGTDPLNEDTDSDIMPDGWEVVHSLDPLVNDSALDPDMDLLTNLGEYYHNTHPQDPDTDDDGLLDGEEVNIYFTDPLEEDSDSDGLLDGEEVNIYGTDPLNEDTDSDGLSDGDEVNIYGTDPLSGDTDSDTMPDKWEVDNLLDPLVNDTALDPDNDLLTNILEYQHSTDPQNPDTDGDGWTDGDEVNHGTDPLDPDSHPSKKSEAIPGYTMSLLMGVFCIVALFIIKKYRKHIIHN